MGHFYLEMAVYRCERSHLSKKLIPLLQLGLQAPFSIRVQRSVKKVCEFLTILIGNTLSF